MADQKISDLAAAAALTGADLTELEQPGETAGTRSRKVTLALLKAFFENSAIVTDATTARAADPVDAGSYVRFTDTAAKTYTFDDADSFVPGTEFTGRNAGATGDLTFVAAGSMVINNHSGGTLIIAPGRNFILKIVTSTLADLILL